MNSEPLVPASTSALRRSDGSALRVLIVDDEVLLLDALAIAFRSDGWDVRTTDRGLDVLVLARKFEPDVIILDIMLPDVDGVEVLARLRGGRKDSRVLFLTAKDAHADKIAGLTAGGDDYVTKPFSIGELIARARSLARSSANVISADADADWMVSGDLRLDEQNREAQRDGSPIELSGTEFDLLQFFMRNPRRVLTRDEILAHVWGFDFGTKSNLVEMYVLRLRRKIGSDDDPKIHTVRGAGYILKQSP
ncbi:MAG: transcriptional regulator [Glaciihabitans sp.]|nr:transcriptional regulator [Glaciihabitans sp.]MDQ1572419.1 two-component system, OmpR family, response regulator [Actinomycetota bacterium]